MEIQQKNSGISVAAVLRGYALHFRWLAVASLAANLLLLAVPLHMMQVYDRVLSSGSLETLFYLTAIAAVAMIGFGIVETLRQAIAQRYANRWQVAKTDRLFGAVGQNSLSERDGQAAMQSIRQVTAFLSSRAWISLYDLPFTVIFLGLLTLLHWQLGLITAAGAMLLVAISILTKSTTTVEQERAAAAEQTARQIGMSTLRQREEVHALGMSPNLIERWGGSLAASIADRDTASLRRGMFHGAGKTTRQILQIGVLAWGAYLVLAGDLSGGIIFAAALLSGRALQPIEQAIGAWDHIQQAANASATLSRLLPGGEARSEATVLPEPQGVLTATGLNHWPGGDRQRPPVLDNANFSASPGELVVIIGRSGSGKSTLARLLSGALSPGDGTVRLDGFDLKSWRPDQRGNAIGYIAQDTQLFPVSVAENIARMSTRLDDAAVIAAAKKAGIHEMIAKLPDGYATLLGPDGVTPSGGQLQRLSLARAFYGDPKALILDEPNAHLDAEAETLLTETLCRARDGGMTVVVMTQRRGLLARADHVLKLEGGILTDVTSARRDKAPGTDVALPASLVRALETGQVKLNTPNRVRSVERTAVGGNGRTGHV